jgi:mono/diheme cytochrome c family protein
MTSQRKIRARQAALIFVLGFSLPGISAQAQDAGAGEKIARTWCGNCHQIGSETRKTNDAVPSFASIANMSSTTQLSLSVFLSTPHGRMPDYALSRAEIRDVSAYIISLRKAR